MTVDLPIFLNPHAGSSNKREELEQRFRESGAHIEIIEAEGPGFQARMRALVAAGVPAIGIAGGDGTMSAAASILAGSETSLLPIPLGTFNHFAKRYGVLSIEAAVHAWQQAAPHRIHVGAVNERVFINNASCGFYPRAVRLRNNLEKVVPRAAAMWLAGSNVLLRLRLLEIQLDAQGRERRLRTPALWVGIGVNSLRLPAPGDAPLPHPVLEAVSGRAHTRLQVVALGFRLFRHLKRGLEPRDEKLEVVRARHFTITAPKPIDIALDGEPLKLRGPLDFTIRENALKVLALVAPAH